MKPQILVVDDEPNVRLSYRATLELEDYVISEADGGSKALQELARQPFDLAILDLKMPEMNGLDLLAEMRRRKLSTPTVMITAYGDLPDAVRAMKLGAIDFLKKPMTPEALRQVVASVLQRHAPEAAEPEAERDDFETHMSAAKRQLNL